MDCCREADDAIAGLNRKPPLDWSVTYARHRDDDLIEELASRVESRLGIDPSSNAVALRRPAPYAAAHRGQANAADYYGTNYTDAAFSIAIIV